MKNLISIGQFSKQTGLSSRALRLYDELEVLKPAFVDPDTGYRLYCPDQLSLAQKVFAMRQLGIPLPLIREVASQPDRTREILEHHHREMQGQLVTIQSKVLMLERALEAGGESVR